MGLTGESSLWGLDSYFVLAYSGKSGWDLRLSDAENPDLAGSFDALAGDVALGTSASAGGPVDGGKAAFPLVDSVDTTSGSGLQYPEAISLAEPISVTASFLVTDSLLRLSRTTVPLLSFGALWRYLANGTDLGTLWRDPLFNDSGWSSGAGQLGYGDGDEVTVVSYGADASNKFITTYFRTSFDLADPSILQQLDLSVVRDDGVVFYLNGVEVMRNNMPSGSITSATRASSGVSGADEVNPFQANLLLANLPAGTLRSGRNVLAAEIHQSDPTSSDISFDADLAGSSSYLQVDIDLGAPLASSSLQLTDLLIDGVASALGVSQLDADTIRFRLPVLGAGSHSLSLAAGSLMAADGTALGAWSRSITIASTPQYTVWQTPRLQLGNAPLTGFAGSSSDQVELLWQTRPSGGGGQDRFTVDVRLAGSAAWSPGGTIQQWAQPVDGRIVFSSLLGSLQYATDYEYRVRHWSGDVLQAEYSAPFRTRLSAGNSTPFSFVAYGDSADANSINQFRSVQARINSLDQVSPLAFALLLGDNAYSSGTHAELDYRFVPSLVPEATAWNSRRIDYAAFGNHDIYTDGGAPSEASFSSPIPVAGVTSVASVPSSERPEHNYSFDYGNVHIATFDSNSLYDPARLDAQLKWLEADMAASKATWKLVVAHHPVAGSPDKPESPLDNYYQQVVSRLRAAKVDLLLSGHTHTYHESYPLLGQSSGVANYVFDPDGVYDKGAGLVQVAIGTGGTLLRDGNFSSYPFLRAGYSTSTASRSEPGFSRIDVSGDALKVNYIAADDGAVLSSITILSSTAPSPSSSVYLSDLSPTSATNGWGPYERDRSNGEQAAGDGKTITLNGLAYAKGIGVHSASSLAYNLGGLYSRFQSYIGIDDEVGSKGSVIFRVLADGVQLFSSGVHTGGSPIQFVDLDVTGRQGLQLIVDSNGAADYDHADWADAKLLGSPASPADTSAPLATLSASSITAVPAGAYTFTVRYDDATGVSVASIDNADIRVTGPNGYSELATRVSTNPEINAASVTATYSISAPGVGWDSADNGTYQIALLAGAVADTAVTPNTTSAVNLGSFTVNLVAAVNQPPSAVSVNNSVISLEENSPIVSDLKLADILINDDNLGSNTITLKGPDAALFSISGLGLYLKADTSLNYEQKSSLVVTVEVSDQALVGSTPVSTTYTLAVANVQEGPGTAGAITAQSAQAFSEGVTLVAPSVLNDPDGVASVVSVEWLFGGKVLGTGSTFMVGATQWGDWQSRITYLDGMGASTTVNASQSVVMVDNGAGVLAPISASGPLRVGAILTAGSVSGDPDGDAPTPSYSYQWLRGGDAISGATASSYTTTSSDLNVNLSVTVTYRDGQGYSRGLSSAVAGPIQEATPPLVAGISVENNLVALAFNEPIQATVPNLNTLVVQVAGLSRTISGLSVDAANNRLLLTLSSAPTSDQSVAVTYTDPAGEQTDGVLQDVVGNDLASFTARAADTLHSAVSVSTLASTYATLMLMGTANINGSGNANANLMVGNAAANTLQGNAGNDTLRGAAGNDTLLGGDNDDWLAGGGDIDVLTGGNGNDVFDYRIAGDGLIGGTDSVPLFDRISDLNIGSDRIDGMLTSSSVVRVLTSKPSQLTRTAISSLLNTKVKGVFNLAANGASAFTFGSGTGMRTFLAINDATAGYNASTDQLLEITGYTGSLASLIVI